jgi:hypothetical protein
LGKDLYIIILKPEISFSFLNDSKPSGSWSHEARIRGGGETDDVVFKYMYISRSPKAESRKQGVLAYSDAFPASPTPYFSAHRLNMEVDLHSLFGLHVT